MNISISTELRDAFSSDSSIPSPCTQCDALIGTLRRTKPNIIPLEFVRSFSPSPRHRAPILGLISASEAAIQALVNEFSDIQARISNLRKIKQVQESLLAPIRKLPDDILNIIFRHARGEYIEIANGLGTIWVLQQVCIRWRTIIQGTPSLWCSFKIENDDWYPEHLRRFRVPLEDSAWVTPRGLRRLEFCLASSKSSPLSFTVSYPAISQSFGRGGSLRKEAEVMISNITDLLIKHTHRWAGISFNKGVLDRFQSQLEGQSLSQLRRLTLSQCSSCRPAFHIFRDAVALEEVKLESLYLSNLSNISWSNLKKLTIHNCNGENILPVLRSMPLLEVLSIEQHSDEIFQESSPATVNLPSLRVLEISLWTIECICPILHVPQLTSLRISGAGASEKNTSGLYSMVETSGCIIKRLEIWMSSRWFIESLIRNLRDIEELYVMHPGSYYTFIQDLVWNPDSENEQLLPSLNSLELIVGNGEDEDSRIEVSSLLTDVVLSRSRPSTSIMNKTLEHTGTSVPSGIKSVICNMSDDTEPTEENEDRDFGPPYISKSMPFSRLKNLGKVLGIKMELPAERKIVPRSPRPKHPESNVALNTSSDESTNTTDQEGSDSDEDANSD